MPSQITQGHKLIALRIKHDENYFPALNQRIDLWIYAIRQSQDLRSTESAAN
jgi:hypothetical protein